MRLTGRKSALAATLAVAMTLAMPGVASAATTLTSGTWVNRSGRQPATADYRIATTGPYWSVAFVRPGYLLDSPPVLPAYTEQVLDGTGSALASSQLGTNGMVAFAAIDGNLRTPQNYTVRMKKINDSARDEQYGLVFVNGDQVAARGTSIIHRAAGTEPNNVYVRDIWVEANSVVRVTVAGLGMTCSDTVGTLDLQAYIMRPPAQGTAPFAVEPAEKASNHSLELVQNGPNCQVDTYSLTSPGAWFGLVIMAPRSYGDLAVTVTEEPSTV
jgi:hypothetical protein